jgi:DNA-binding winged helix-turn-helix (wHTH) protein
VEPVPDILCFNGFEVDLTNRTLKKDGLPVRVQDQPFHVLTVLLRHHNSVVRFESFAALSAIPRRIRNSSKLSRRSGTGSARP